jgi:ATP-dependent RNA helicase DHX29
MSNSSEDIQKGTDNEESKNTSTSSETNRSEETKSNNKAGEGEKKGGKESRGGKSSRSNSVTQPKEKAPSNSTETANGKSAGKSKDSNNNAASPAPAEDENKSGKSALPIDAYREEILRRVNRDRVTIIHGETGCGKSSRLPLILLEDAEERGKACRMMVSQPRRIAASSLMKRLRGLVGNKVSF